MANFNGTTGIDVIFGTGKDDLIRGFSGGDNIISLGGNDTIEAGSGE
jgi:Ca2+-binding RTX toxin-like protein